MVGILPADSKHPPRPDVPILRHLTYREAHLFEIGIWPGIAFGMMLIMGDMGAALALVAVIRRKMQNKNQEEDNADALKGYVKDGWYLGTGALFGAFGITVGYTILQLISTA